MQHVERENLCWSGSRYWSNKRGFGMTSTCLELKFIVGKTAANLFALVQLYSLFFFQVQSKLGLVDFALNVVVRKFVLG